MNWWEIPPLFADPEVAVGTGTQKKPPSGSGTRENSRGTTLIPTRVTARRHLRAHCCATFTITGDTGPVSVLSDPVWFRHGGSRHSGRARHSRGSQGEALDFGGQLRRDFVSPAAPACTVPGSLYLQVSKLLGSVVACRVSIATVAQTGKRLRRAQPIGLSARCVRNPRGSLTASARSPGPHHLVTGRCSLWVTVRMRISLREVGWDCRSLAG